LRSPLAFPAGCGFVALRRGGAELLGRGVIARPIRAAPEGRKALAAALPRAVASTDALEEAGFGRDRSLALRVSVAVFYQGWTAAPEGVPLGVALKAGFEPAPAPGAADEAAFLFDPVRWAAYAEAVAAAAAEPGGLSRATGESIFASVLGAASRQADSLAGARAADSKSAFEASVSRLEAQKALSRNGAAWTVPGSARALSPAERETLERLVAAGTSGLEPGKTAQREDARPLKALCSFGEAVPLDGGIFFSRAAYEACSAAILRGRKPGDRFTVPEAKERSALSRKYILPLLNRMESKGLVKRSGDERIVL
ncbi:MAG: SelB C-terminal domain-containing protein, partial [Spirochaetes bacterium]|nr:SelB C-terminal domain-containing protein [Spirochaetota bacterium]